MRLLSSLFRLLLLLVLPVLLFGVLMAVILLAGIGVGKILMRFVALSLFEAAVLSLIAESVAGYLTWRIMRTRVDEGSDFVDDDPFGSIPTTRFAKDGRELTQAGLVQYLLANAIYSAWMAEMELEWSRDNAEWKDLAVQLAQGVTTWLRAKPPQTRQVRVGADVLRRELSKLGVGDETDALYGPSLRAVWETVEVSQDHIVEIFREQSWDK